MNEPQLLKGLGHQENQWLSVPSTTAAKMCGKGKKETEIKKTNSQLNLSDQC